MEVCSRGSNWKSVNIGSGNGLAPNRWQVNTLWYNVDPDLWHHNAPLGHNELNRLQQNLVDCWCEISWWYCQNFFHSHRWYQTWNNRNWWLFSFPVSSTTYLNTQIFRPHNWVYHGVWAQWRPYGIFRSFCISKWGKMQTYNNMSLLLLLVLKE